MNMHADMMNNVNYARGNEGVAEEEAWLWKSVHAV